MPSDNAWAPRTAPHEAPGSPRELAPEISGYLLMRKLASGGMATVWLAQRRSTDTLCVIKLLHPHLAKDPVVSNRFLREAAVASELSHPNIARLIDAGRQGELFYIAVEFIAGQDLETMIVKLFHQGKMLPPAMSLTVALRVLDGLGFAHDYADSEGRHLAVVHRDMSPRNVMVTYEGDVKIIDFGLARTNLGSFRTAPGMVLGTLRYMSPEQAVAEPVDSRSDIYSLGVVLYEMLSGHPLVRGDTPSEILRAVVTLVPPPISSLNPALPPSLDGVFAKALEKDREARYASAALLRTALLTAAPGLCGARREDIGTFVRHLFPEDQRQAHEWMREAELGEHAHADTRLDDAPEFLPTRAGTVGDVTEMSPMDPPDLTHIVEPMPDLTRATELVTRLPTGPLPRRGRPATVYALTGVLLVAVLTVIMASLAIRHGAESEAVVDLARGRVTDGVELRPSAAPTAASGTAREPSGALSTPGPGVRASEETAVGRIEPGKAASLGDPRERPARVGSDRTRTRMPTPKPEGGAQGASTPSPGPKTRAVAQNAGTEAEVSASSPADAKIHALKRSIQKAKSEKEIQEIVDGAALKKTTLDCISRWIYISFNRDKAAACLDQETKKP